MELFLYGKSYCLFQRYDGFHPYIADVPYLSVLVPVLVRVPEYLSTSTSTSTMTLELTSTSTRNSVLRVLSTSTPALIIRNWPLFLVHSVIQSNYVSPLHRRCTIEYQYSCQYSYEYLSTCPRVQVRVLWLWNSRVRVQEIQYYEYWVRVPQPW